MSSKANEHKKAKKAAAAVPDTPIAATTNDVPVATPKTNLFQARSLAFLEKMNKAKLTAAQASNRATYDEKAGALVMNALSAPKIIRKGGGGVAPGVMKGPRLTECHTLDFKELPGKDGGNSKSGIVTLWNKGGADAGTRAIPYSGGIIVLPTVKETKYTEEQQAEMEANRPPARPKTAGPPGERRCRRHARCEGRRRGSRVRRGGRRRRSVRRRRLGRRRGGAVAAPARRDQGPEQVPREGRGGRAGADRARPLSG